MKKVGLLILGCMLSSVSVLHAASVADMMNSLMYGDVDSHKADETVSKTSKDDVDETRTGDLFYRAMLRAATIDNVKKEICSLGYTNAPVPHFRDVDVSTREGKAVDQMADYCIVHGYGNNGLYYGLNNVLTKGEAYKIFVRLLAIDHRMYSSDDAHWALPFFAVGRKIGLWDGVHDAGGLDDPIMLDDFVHIVENIGNAINRIYKKDRVSIDYDALDGKVIKRGTVAVLIAHLMDKLYMK